MESFLALVTSLEMADLTPLADLVLQGPSGRVLPLLLEALRPAGP